MRKVLFALTLTSFVLMLSFHGEAIEDESLVLYLSFDEGKGEEVKDLSGNENHGKLIGEPEWVKGKYGSALKFSGESNKDHVEVADSPSLNPEKEITCMAWIYFDEFHNSAGVISKYIGAGNNRSYNLRMHHPGAELAISSECSSNGQFQVGTSTTEAHTPAGSLKEAEWQHIAMTFKAKDFLRLYINGEMKAESKADATDHIFDNEVPLYVGTDFDPGGAHAGNPREFTGIIDEVVVFNRALSDTGIKQKMESVLAVEPKGKLATLWGRLKIK